MAAAETLRVQVRVSARLHPELFATLAPIGLRGRADRLRQLALLGLSGQRVANGGQSLPVNGPAGVSAAPAAEQMDPALAARRARVLGALSMPD
jgi:hypothetical protein